MVALKWLLVILGLGLFGSAGALLAYDVYVASQLRRLLKRKSEEGVVGTTTFLPARPFGPVRWQRAVQLAVIALVPVLIAKSIAVVPDGSAQGGDVAECRGGGAGKNYRQQSGNRAAEESRGCRGEPNSRDSGCGSEPHSGYRCCGFRADEV